MTPWNMHLTSCNLWAVQHKAKPNPESAIKVETEEEARFLVSALNEREVLWAQLHGAQAQITTLVEKLTRITNLTTPPDIHENGKTLRFIPPDPEIQLHQLSTAIREALEKD